MNIRLTQINTTLKGNFCRSDFGSTHLAYHPYNIHRNHSAGKVNYHIKGYKKQWQITQRRGNSRTRVGLVVEIDNFLGT